MTRIKAVYEDLILRLGHSRTIASDKWDIISAAYNSSSRFYHNLNHLEAMLFELEKVKEEIKDWDSILFSLIYHDFVYDSFRGDNEALSAEFASTELTALNLNNEQIDKIKETILATKSHDFKSDHDMNVFLDADLSILGADKKMYDNYSRNVRLEFIQYPSFVFYQGRIKVLEYFLSHSSIYKTDFFKKQFEQKAVENLSRELNELKRMNKVFQRTDTNEFVQYLESDGDLSEFFHNAAKILDETKNIEKITYYPGWFDSGYYRFKYKGTPLHLEYDGMLGTLLRTESNATDADQSHAEEIFQELIEVRLTKEDLERVRKFYTDKNRNKITKTSK
ncbi:HD domain-containing protein [Fluviicola taffensis]|uniref:Uncharacterized protein n=1 Tax=Fluviicola taffensis (strain DSM 16823 / NCIMB 13979 / RW262) TaxID=755732 RepID=F2IET4_FLUTR|nr:phosphohydrolase [Fluviicola taffensis]AEA45651.1 hypothetical protein Fluta_3683 [Fluviicola taffensis DSM 16823]